MNLDEQLAALGNVLQRQLSEEFPGWRITRKDSGGWVAVRPGWGTLYGDYAAELRDRLRHHISRGNADV